MMEFFVNVFINKKNFAGKILKREKRVFYFKIKK